MSREGVGAVAVAALRRRPSHASEQVSQLLLGEPFRVLGRDAQGAWLRIRCELDAYEGWVRSWHLALQDARAARRWRSAPAWRVADLLALVRHEPSARGEPLAPLPWGAVLLAAGRPTVVGSGWVPVKLPSGDRGYIRRKQVAWRAAVAPAPTPAGLERTARKFLGVPYEWGGRSSWGLDCSGFVQAVLAWHGISLPRDAWMQARALGFRPRRNGSCPSPRWRAGDLAFFGPDGGRLTHVGIVGRGGILLHALGRVRADTLDGSREVIIRQLLTTFRAEFPPALG